MHMWIWTSKYHIFARWFSFICVIVRVRNFGEIWDVFDLLLVKIITYWDGALSKILEITRKYYDKTRRRESLSFTYGREVRITRRSFSRCRCFSSDRFHEEESGRLVFCRSPLRRCEIDPYDVTRGYCTPRPLFPPIFIHPISIFFSGRKNALSFLSLCLYFTFLSVWWTIISANLLF